ncbi:uncharacterized protein B0T15DRAFT_520640 [Chaetomium strumarium]|uniref:Uncharacterized protein n=1 Tax=Chaetomium strumarium TaxID=1170767 RepID=A0AAJ0H413_9PEZI|nr:hypothetical protein B0T15DRAFT_520640 [Chaetomium strumarium]
MFYAPLSGSLMSPSTFPQSHIGLWPGHEQRAMPKRPPLCGLSLRTSEAASSRLLLAAESDAKLAYRKKPRRLWRQLQPTRLLPTTYGIDEDLRRERVSGEWPFCELSSPLPDSFRGIYVPHLTYVCSLPYKITISTIDYLLQPSGAETPSWLRLDSTEPLLTGRRIVARLSNIKTVQRPATEPQCQTILSEAMQKYNDPWDSKATDDVMKRQRVHTMKT